MPKRQKKVTVLHPPEPEGETRRQKFERIGKARMNRILNSIRLLGNLASPNYEWTEHDVEIMQARIVGVLGQTLARFEKRKRGEKVHFEFETEDQPQF